MKKLEAINQVQECMSSVFSKEDVINLINKIDSDNNKLSVGLAVKIKESIERELMDMDKRSLISYVFSITVCFITLYCDWHSVFDFLKNCQVGLASQFLDNFL